MVDEEKELKVNLVDGKPFVVEPHSARDVGTQAKHLLDNGVIDKHDDGSWTHHPARQLKNVTVQPKGTALSGGQVSSVPWPV